MSEAIYSALKSSASAHFTALETTANNLANVDTVGYRSMTPVFHEVLEGANASARENATVRASVVRRTALDTTPGALRTTGNPLDLAFAPDTFLALSTPAGERYTRAGSLKVAPDGTLTTQRGMPVANAAQEPIVVSPDATVTISSQGEVLANGASAGFLRMVSFAQPGEMSYEGQGVLTANAEAGEATPTNGPIAVGQLEESNASTVRAMTDMMSASRMFEALENAMGTFHQLDRRLVTTVPKAT